MLVMYSQRSNMKEQNGMKKTVYFCVGVRHYRSKITVVIYQ
jgi:hypothetical protein